MKIRRAVRAAAAIARRRPSRRSRATGLASVGAAALILLAGCGRLSTPEMVPTASPVRIVFDTDMDTDCDDAGALAMLHALADLGEVEVLATMVSSHYPYSAPAVDVINTFFGRPDLPIGVPKAPGASTHRGSRYAEGLAREYVHDLRNADDASDAVDLYRRVLAAQPDTSVVIVTVGYLTNLRYLLASRADRHSALSGRELVKRKVKRLVAMGGTYPAHDDPREFGNFKPDPAATVIVARDWPRPLVFVGDEIGDPILTGSALASAPPANPVRRAYELYFGEVGKERPSWDQTALLHAVRPEAGYWREIRGRNHIFPDGTNKWRDPQGDSLHRYLVEAAPREEITRVIEDLMLRSPGGAGHAAPE